MKVFRVLWVLLILSTFGGMAFVLCDLYISGDTEDVLQGMVPYTDYTINVYNEKNPINIYEFLDSHQHHCIIVKVTTDIALSCGEH